MKNMVILGASGHGKVVADCAEMNGWEVIGFFDDAWPSKTYSSHWPILGDTAALLARAKEFDGVMVAIGNNSIRQNKLTELSMSGASIPVLIHPSAVVSRFVKIGAGSILIAGSIVNIDSQIGAGVIINTGASVGHDCVIGNSAHIAPGAKLAGNITVGERSWVGVGSAVCQMVNIGSDVMIGAGAAVVHDLPDAGTFVGVPARKLI